MDDNTGRHMHRVGNQEPSALSADFSGIAHLATHLPVERRGRQDNAGFLSLPDFPHRTVFYQDTEDYSFLSQGAVTGKLSGHFWHSCNNHVWCVGGEPQSCRARCNHNGASPASLPLLLHLRPETGHVYSKTTFFRNLFRNLHWETIGIVELEGSFARNLFFSPSGSFVRNAGQ